jgi:hypothetical protein
VLVLPAGHGPGPPLLICASLVCSHVSLWPGPDSSSCALQPMQKAHKAPTLAAQLCISAGPTAGMLGWRGATCLDVQIVQAHQAKAPHAPLPKPNKSVGGIKKL